MMNAVQQPTDTNVLAETGLSMPKIMLHLEGLTVFFAVIAVYANQGFSALAFIALLFVPDISLLGYLASTKVGSYTYNLAHFYAFPIALASVGLLLDESLAIQLGLIWTAHVGMDRMLGFGLKYPTQFKATHLNRV